MNLDQWDSLIRDLHCTADDGPVSPHGAPPSANSRRHNDRKWQLFYPPSQKHHLALSFITWFDFFRCRPVCQKHQSGVRSFICWDTSSIFMQHRPERMNECINLPNETLLWCFLFPCQATFYFDSTMFSFCSTASSGSLEVQMFKWKFLKCTFIF